MRKTGTGLRIGKVSSIDYKTGMIQVVYTDKADAVTARLPYANFNNEYCMPKIGERVLVGHMSNGSSRGVVIGTIWNKKNIPPEHGKGLYRKELSKKQGAAYVRFDENSGEYLVRVPVVLLHGIDRTDLEGPEVNIAANVKTGFESPEHKAVVRSVHVKGLEGEDITAGIANNVKIVMDSGQLEALVKGIVLETVEALEVKAGDGIKLSAGSDVELEDGKFATTLSAILERLEALDGDRSARK